MFFPGNRLHVFLFLGLFAIPVFAKGPVLTNQAACLLEMIGTPAASEKPSGLEAMPRPPGLEVAMASTARTASVPKATAKKKPGVKENIQFLQDRIIRHFKLLFPDEELLGPHRFSDQPLQIQLRAIRHLTSLNGGVKLTRRLLLRIEKAEDREEKHTQGLRDQLQYLVQQMGALRRRGQQGNLSDDQAEEKYLPHAARLVRDAVQELGDASVLAGGSSRDEYEPLQRLIKANAKDFNRVLTARLLLDEAQGKLLFHLVNLTLDHPGIRWTDPLLRDAIENLWVACLRNNVESLSPKSFGAFLALTEETEAEGSGTWAATMRTSFVSTRQKLNPEALYAEENGTLSESAAATLASLLKEVRRYQIQLAKARQAYAIRRRATVFCLYLMMKDIHPTGRDRTPKTDEVIERTWVKDLPPILREMLLSVVKNSFEELAPKDLFGGKSLEAILELPIDELDPLLLPLINNRQMFDDEYTLSIRYDLRAAIELMKPLVSEREWARIQTEMVKIMKQTTQAALKSTPGASAAEPFANAILSAIGGGNGDTATAASTTAAKQAALPPDLFHYITADQIPTPWDVNALAFTREAIPENPTVGARDTRLSKVISVLNAQARLLLNRQDLVWATEPNPQRPAAAPATPPVTPPNEDEEEADAGSDPAGETAETTVTSETPKPQAPAEKPPTAANTSPADPWVKLLAENRRAAKHELKEDYRTLGDALVALMNALIRCFEHNDYRAAAGEDLLAQYLRAFPPLNEVARLYLKQGELLNLKRKLRVASMRRTLLTMQGPRLTNGLDDADGLDSIRKKIFGHRFRVALAIGFSGAALTLKWWWPQTDWLRKYLGEFLPHLPWVP